MKIKADFVTNSSSTAYIMFVPPNYELNEEELQKVAQKHWDDGEGNSDSFDTAEEYKERVLEDFEDFMGDSFMYEEDAMGFYTLKEILTSKFEILSIDIGPDSGQIHNISSEKVNEIIATADLIKMKEEKNASET